MPTYGNMQWGSPSTPSYLSPVTMAMMGMNTSGAGQGKQYNTQTGAWEDPTGVNAGITGGRLGPPGQTNYSGMPDPGNGMSASGFANSPGLGNGGFGPQGPTPPATGGRGQYDPVLNPTGWRPGTGTPGMDAGGMDQGVSDPRFSNQDTPGGVGQYDPVLNPTGQRNMQTKPMQLGAGGPNGGGQDFFALLNQLQGFMRQRGMGQGNDGRTSSGAGSEFSQMPIAAPYRVLPGGSQGGFYAPNQVTPQNNTGQAIPVDQNSLSDIWSGSGGMNLQSLSMGNRPGMRSPFGQTGGMY